jgi:predicted  nucleic acid-binding Zn-ribbon protein
LDRPSQERDVKAAPDDQRALLDLQDADSATARLQHQLRTLPERERSDAAATAAERAAADTVRAQTEVADLQRAVRRAEEEVAAVRARADRDRAMLESGSVTSARQVSDLDHEVSSLARRQSDLEDAELEILEQLEVAEAGAAQAQQDSDAARARLDEERQALATAVADLEAALVAAGEERHRKAESVPPDLLRHYEQLRERGGFLVVALLRARRCEACQMELASADLDEARSAAPDEVIHCPECGAILVRTEESGL